MSAVKVWLEQELEKLADETGYTWEYLLDAYNFYTGFGTDSLFTFDDFKEMALRHDFDGIEFFSF